MTGDGAGTPALLSHTPARPVAVITMNSSGVVIEFSAEAERMFGYTQERAVGVRMSDLIVPARLRMAHEAGLARYLATGVGPLFDQTFELPALRADGSEILVELVVTRVHVGEEEVFTGIVREAHEHLRRVPGELALSEAFFRTLVDRSPIATAVVNDDGSWRWSSEAGLRLHGPIPPDCAQIELDSDEDRARILQLIKATAAGEPDTEPVNVRLRGLDGTLHLLTVAAENMLTEPAIHGIGLYATDTTRLYEAEQRVKLEEARLRTLIDSLAAGVLLQDEQHRIVFANSAFTELFEVATPPDQLVGQPVTAVAAANPFADQEASDIRGNELLHNPVRVIGEEYALVNGRIVERDYAPVRLDGALLGHLWVFRDVTDQSEIRRGLVESNRALAELANLKTEFIATASHELRTPLTSILTFAHLMEEPGAGPAEHTRALGAITRNADRMLRLVDDLILLASLEAGTAPLRTLPVDLPAMVADAIEAWRPVAADSGVTITEELETGPRLQGDGRHLHQLIDTLCGTAVARTPRLGHITITLRSEERGWRLRLRCAGGAGGTGAGAGGAGGAGGDHIYARPGRHDDPAAAHSNALALLLSRAIVTRHGGEMTSPSEERGMVYDVCIPLIPPELEP